MLAALGLAKLKAKAGDPGAIILADNIASAFPKSPPAVMGNQWNQALVYADLGGIYLRFSKTEAAADCLSKSVALWRDMKIAAVLDAQRQKELAAVEAALQRLRLARPSGPPPKQGYH